MGIAERKEREKLEMRERILETAKQLFLEEGYEKTSIRSIAERIEYSPGTIYLYFTDKDEIFHEIHFMAFEQLKQEMKRSVEQVEDPLMQLRKLGEVYLNFGVNNPELYDLMFILRSPVAKLLSCEQHWHQGEDCFSFFRKIVENAIQKGALRPMDTVVASMMIWSQVHGMVSLFVRDRFSVMGFEKPDIYAMMFASMDQMLANIKA